MIKKILLAIFGLAFFLCLDVVAIVLFMTYKHHKEHVILIQCLQNGEDSNYSQAWVKIENITAYQDEGIAWKYKEHIYYIKSSQCTLSNATTEDATLVDPKNYIAVHDLDSETAR